MEDFTSKTGAITRHLKNMEPGDGGAAILDAVRFSVDLLEEQPQGRRRILLLISESRDHGSKKTQASELVERIGTSNTLVLALTYSASGAEFLNDIKGGGSVGYVMTPGTPVMAAIAAMHKNVAKQLAEMSGGEYAPFVKEKGFEDRVAGGGEACAQPLYAELQSDGQDSGVSYSACEAERGLWCEAGGAGELLGGG